MKFPLKKLLGNHVMITNQNSYKGHRGAGGKSLFSHFDFILKSFIQATRCFLQISKIQSNFEI